MAAAIPAAYLPKLAVSLNNSGVRHAAVDKRTPAALAAAEEATEIYRRMAGADAAAWLPSLAMTLNNLGIRYADLDRREEALSAAVESAVLYRRLAEANPAAWLTDVAMSLSNIAVAYSEARDEAKAVAAADDAVRIRRQLVQVNPAAELPELATSLWASAWVRLQARRELPQALTAVEEAVAIYRPLAEQLPGRFGGQIRSAYHTMGGDPGGAGPPPQGRPTAAPVGERGRRLVCLGVLMAYQAPRRTAGSSNRKVRQATPLVRRTPHRVAA